MLLVIMFYTITVSIGKSAGFDSSELLVDGATAARAFLHWDFDQVAKKIGGYWKDDGPAKRFDKA